MSNDLRSWFVTFPNANHQHAEWHKAEGPRSNGSSSLIRHLIRHNPFDTAIRGASTFDQRSFGEIPHSTIMAFIRQSSGLAPPLLCRHTPCTLTRLMWPNNQLVQIVAMIDLLGSHLLVQTSEPNRPNFRPEGILVGPGRAQQHTA
ncbi:hypothetical protein E3N88_44932 [Mikania micrantha]|uniref:Uncharacterized protein n=1 Tax=Mikania micrantha TaxID=192012 RepID=A0A5N6LAV6_9ASTR|nr:hypothetical protein E3N88_44932 [Mikania micrantha]